MKKFLSSLLVIFATMVALPAYADDACKNLFDESKYAGTAFELDNDGIWRNTSADTRTQFVFYTQFFVGDTPTSVSPVVVTTPRRYSTTFTLPENVTVLTFKHNGSRLDFRITTRTAVPEAGTYTVSFDVLSADPTTVGGVQIQNIQLERGSTATSYVPYNPLCATCDGTVVSYETVAAADVPAGVQNGTPTPENPIEPVFYTQGDMVLRRIGDYADSYDATTGKITRRIGYHVFNGAEAITLQQSHMFTYSADGKRHGVAGLPISTHFVKASSTGTYSVGNNQIGGSTNTDNISVWIRMDSIDTIQDFKQFLLDQYAAGTPVTVYYPLATPVEEDWSSSYCQLPIKIATTKYSNAQFTPVVNALNTAVSTIKDVVANTITQTAAIAQIASDKQTRPSSGCPAGKTCLLVEDMNGEPHWYEIIEEYIPPETEPTPAEPEPVTP